MKIKILILQFLIGVQGVCAQSNQPDVCASSGDFFKTAQYSLCWTLGECMTETFIGTSNKLTQGFQQSSYLVTAVKPLTNNGIQFSVYPNPTSDKVSIRILLPNETHQLYLLELFNMSGMKLFEDHSELVLYELNLAKYPTGSYMLNILNHKNMTTQQFKIIKTN